MRLYHPRALADKLEGLVPELQRWSHRANMALENAQRQQKRTEDRRIQTGHSAQMREHQLVVDQEAVRQTEVLLQLCERNCQQALAQAQQRANTAQSILNETQTTHNRLQQALQSAQAALVQKEKALAQATATVEKRMKGLAKANERGVPEEKRGARHGLSMAKKAEDQASKAARAASAHVANCKKALTIAEQALRLARETHQQALDSLKASEDSIGFVRAASKALDLGKRELGQEDVIVNATSEALQYTALITQESATQLGAARAHEQPAQQHTADTLRILQIKIGLLLFMNRPELAGPSDPMVASSQLAPVRDRAEQPTLDPQLERLQTRLEKIYGLQPQQWSKLNLAERQEMLQHAHNAVAATYRFKPSLVIAVPLPSEDRGVFFHGVGLILINIKLVAGNDQVQPLRTLIHESRHAYQWHFVQRFKHGALFFSEADCELAQKWKDNFDDYKSPEQNSFRAYFNQPVESDARSFAQTVIKLLFGG